MLRIVLEAKVSVKDVFNRDSPCISLRAVMGGFDFMTVIRPVDSENIEWVSGSEYSALLEICVGDHRIEALSGGVAGGTEFDLMLLRSVIGRGHVTHLCSVDWKDW